MNAALADSPPWSRRRWWAFLAVVASVQLGLMFWLGEDPAIRPRAPAAAPVLALVPKSTELLALNDPTLFALPHLEGFSGRAWLKTKPPVFPSGDWTEEPSWFSLDESKLGASFTQLTRTNLAYTSPTPPMPEPKLALPETSPPPPWRDRSSFRVEGDLAGRRLLTPVSLPSWQNIDLLTNTIVQVVVTAEGLPLSALLLGRSGHQPADDYALDQARAARFSSLGDSPDILDRPLPHLCWGRLVFEWLTLPSTNPPPPSQ